MALMAFSVSVLAGGEVQPGQSYTFQTVLQEPDYLCLDSQSDRVGPGSGVRLYDCDEDTQTNFSQRWAFTTLGELIGSGATCLDAYHKRGVSGARVRMRPCNGSNFQKWTFHYPIGELSRNMPNVVLKSATGHCIGVAGGKTRKAAALVLLECERESIVIWQQRPSTPTLEVICANKVRALNAEYLTRLGGVNDGSVVRVCREKNNDVLDVFKVYLKRSVDRFERIVINKARKFLN